MCFAYGARSRATSPPTARPRVPVARSAQGSTSRWSTDARLRGVEWGEAACAHTGRPSVQTAVVPTARADACAAKRIARHAARGWKSSPPPRRERRAGGPGGAPEEADLTTMWERGGLEAAEVVEPVGEGMEE